MGQSGSIKLSARAASKRRLCQWSTFLGFIHTLLEPAVMFAGLYGLRTKKPDRVPAAAFRTGLDRYPLLYDKLKAAGFILTKAALASDEDLLLAHSASWLARLKANNLSPEEEEELTLPYSRQILPLSWRMAGGTIAAARAAASSGSLGVFPPGGGHHAFPDRGGGFCPINDIAIAARVLLKNNAVKNPAVIDLDAHQGNGTALIFSNGEVKTFSAHKADGYPRNRTRSSMDADIPAGAGDGAYLGIVRKGVKNFLKMANPDFVFALCSADAYKKDALGGLEVSIEGLRERDEFLFTTLAGLKIPVCLVLGGAYSSPEEAALINFNTIKAAAGAFPLANQVILI